MAINFDALPQSNPIGKIEDDVYFATIVEASMKQGKDPTKPMYLNMRLELKDRFGSKAGTIFDVVTESESAFMMYKISRLVQACKLNITGSMELKDLCKLLTGKQIVLRTQWNKEYNKAEVKAIGTEIYWKLEDMQTIYSELHPDGEVPFMEEPTSNTPEKPATY